MSVRSEGKGSFAAKLFIILALTFAAAYYVPLYRTHTKLVTEYGALSERVTAAEKEAATARADLAAAASQAEALSAERKKNDSERESRSAGFIRVEKDLRAKIGSEGGLTVERRSDRVVLRIASDALRKNAEIVPASTVCAALSALPASFAITAVAGLPDKGAKNPWEAGADRAASVARFLEQKCELPAARLGAGARPGAGGDGGVDLELALAAR